MRMVLDASVAVAAVRVVEPSHDVSLARMLRILRGTDDVVLPALFTIEVASALSRAGEARTAIRRYVDLLTSAAAKIRELDVDGADEACDAAMALGLRAADAVYVSLAKAERLPLCTLDRVMARRAERACAVIAP